ncbi:MAG: transposase, partial [Candidatus Falkowbacteria bacterium]|nr:transposase [Candidatus Falkowbacteria bacterium]
MREDNKRELLALDINPTESSHIWRELFDKKKKRGVVSVELIVADGIVGLENEVHRVFPGAQLQKCVVHKMREVLKKTRPKDKAERADDLKEVFNNFSEG